MTILLDTNVLVSLANPTDTHHALTVETIQGLRSQKVPMRLVPQIVYEFWVVATRDLSANGLGYSPEDCGFLIDHFLSVFPMLEDSPGLFQEWQRLVKHHACRGKISHDARIVAAMHIHQAQQIITYNGADFKRFSGIQPLHPENLKALEG
jgi:predicted nucleic acid-binding protein